MKKFDYIIIGAGAAGSHLLLQMCQHTFFQNKHILVLEKDDKNTYDRTWSYWEKGKGHYDEICLNTWKIADFYHDLHVEMDLGEYVYKTLPSDKFYSYVKEKIQELPLLTWKKLAVDNVKPDKLVSVFCKGGESFLGDFVFDSRIPKNFQVNDPNLITIHQHFKGWLIEADDDVFDPSRMTMMDFRVRPKDKTCFTYVLPFSSKSALIESTFFTKDLIDKADYDSLLKEYIDQVLKIKQYSIRHEEYGIIPMSTFPFHKGHTENYIRIGTAGGWVRPSTGYMFKAAENYSACIVSQLLKSKPINIALSSPRFAFYDRLLLDILDKKNDRGPSIFQAVYRKNPIQRVFRFLDRETHPLEDALFLFSAPKLPFLKALWRQSFS